MKYYVPSKETKAEIDKFFRRKDEAVCKIEKFIEENIKIKTDQFYIDGRLGFIPENREEKLPNYMRKNKDGVWFLWRNTKKGKELSKEFDKLETGGYTSIHFFWKFLDTPNSPYGPCKWKFDYINNEYCLVNYDNIDVKGLVSSGRFIEKEL